MNTKLLLSASSVVMGAAGIAGSFLPHEVLRAAGVPPDGPLPLLVQLWAGSLFAFAMSNWTARGSLIGGIYNRPVAIGNLTHFMMAALAAVKAATGNAAAWLWAVAVVYGVFAVAFAVLFFRSPVMPSRDTAQL